MPCVWRQVQPVAPQSSSKVSGILAMGRGSDRNPGFTKPPGPTEAQRAYLRYGLHQPGGKLPLFDHDGQEISPRTIRACIDHGWAMPWFDNPLKPDWLVCRLTPAGRALFTSHEI